MAGVLNIDRDLPADRKGSIGKSHDIKKIDVSLSSILLLD